VTAEIITGISELTTNDPGHGRIRDAAVVIEDGLVAWIGPVSGAPAADRATDLGGRALLPGWVDSHTHLVFAGDRSEEFEHRMAGHAYAAGGIRTTVDATRAASDEELRRLASRARDVARRSGTTWMEVKTGYALDVAGEARLARLAGEITSDVTFLGAHLVPPGADPDEYVALVTGPMLEAVRPHARWIDVFCERGAFTPEQSRAVLRAGAAAGLGVRVPGHPLGPGQGVALAVELGAAAVDHCNHLSADDVDALATSDTVATLLPACDLSTREPFGPARALIDAGATVALASNANPGTSNTTSMAFCVGTAVLQMRMTIEEAVWAATMGGARALRRHEGPGAIGAVAPGFRADLHALDAPSVAHLAYRPGMDLTHAVWEGGVRHALEHTPFYRERLSGVVGGGPVELDDEELAATADRLDPAARHEVDVREALLGVAVPPDVHHPAPGQLGCQLTADGLDLRQLWHDADGTARSRREVPRASRTARGTTWRWTSSGSRAPRRGRRPRPSRRRPSPVGHLGRRGGRSRRTASLARCRAVGTRPRP
jgi:imidazolonepropionase